MGKQFQPLQRRFGSARPGLELIAVEDAAIPVTVLRADALAQEKKELPVTEEFILRFVAAGVDTPADIAAYLGLDTTHVLDAAAEQLSENHLRRKDSGQRLALTPVGAEVASTLAATRPVLRQLPVSFDRVTWKLADYPESALISKKEACERGMTLLPAVRNARIGLDDATPAEFNRLLKAERLQVLRIHRVAVKKHRYLPVQLLIYGDQSRRELELAVCVEDDLATDHGLALARIGAVERLGLKFEAAEPRPVLEEELESQRTSPRHPDHDLDSQAEMQVAGSGITSLVRSVSVFEHADLLTEALETAKERLLIISPWVRNGVVTTDFLAKLERRLRAKVEVAIAYGIGNNDSGSDESALTRLKNLAVRYENFTFRRLPNTHAKILIFDGHWVSTSFNWLSFRGDPNRTYRMEEGTLVSIPRKVQQQYEHYLKLIIDLGRA